MTISFSFLLVLGRKGCDVTLEVGLNSPTYTLFVLLLYVVECK